MYLEKITVDLLDDMLMSESRPKEERVSLIKIYGNRMYYNGIDKGTELERSVIRQRDESRKAKLQKELSEIVDKVNDYIFENKQNKK